MSTVRSPWEVANRDLRNKVYGVVVALVTDNKDTSGKYRVKVRYPCFGNGDNETSGWARVCTFNAGKDRGMFALPEVGDEVLVAFEHGEIDRPIVVGALWNNTDTPPYDNKDGKNKIRAFKSRSGNLLEFLDDKGKEKITLKTKSGSRIVIDDDNKKLEVYDSKGKNFVLIDSGNNKIHVKSDGDMLLEAKEKLQLKAKTIETKSDKDSSFEAGETMTAKGKKSNVEASQGANIQGGTEVVVGGGTIKLN